MGVILLALVLALPLTLAACQEIGSGNATETTVAAGQEQPSDQEAQPAQGSDSAGDAAAGGEFVSPALGVAEDVSPSVVTVFASQQVSDFFGQPQTQEGSGSGVIYSSDGYIVTNNHVIASQFGGGVVDQVTVRLATGEDLPAQIVGRDPSFDLAVLKVDHADLPAAEFISDISDVRVGQYAIAIGSPLGASFNNSVTLGIVSGIGREIPDPQGSQSLVDLIQTDAAISPGNSGGALVDAEGRVIGINVAYIPPGAGAQDIGFAIPADVAVDVVDDLIQTGQVQHAYVGIGSISVSEVQGQFDVPVDQGVLVAEVYPNTPAAQAGLQRGDVITAIDGRDVRNQADLFAILRRMSPGDEVTLTVVHENGDEEDLQLTLGERPTEFQ